MPILDTEIQYRLSGGSANSNPNASIGGAMSSTPVGVSLHNLFDKVSGQESADGDTEYRCIYVNNANGTLTLQDAEIFLAGLAGNAGVSIEIGLGAAAIGGTEQLVADENTAPVGVTFSVPDAEPEALSIGSLAPGESKAVWIKRIVTPGTSAYNDDSCTLRTFGDTAA